MIVDAKRHPSSSSFESNVRNFTLFKSCSEAFFEHMVSNIQIKQHNKGKVLFVHDDPAERFYLIKSGWVKLYRETIDGTEAVIDILNENNILGETAIFSGNMYPYTAEIVCNAEIISLPLQDLKAEIESNSQFAMDMLEHMARHRLSKEKEIEHRTIKNAPQRIGCFLLRLIDQNEEAPIIIKLPYDKTLVASRLGMQPETFSRALSKLREKTGIRIDGSQIEVNTIDQLVSYCCAACSSEFPCKDLDQQKT